MLLQTHLKLIFPYPPSHGTELYSKGPQWIMVKPNTEPISCGLLPCNTKHYRGDLFSHIPIKDELIKLLQNVPWNKFIRFFKCKMFFKIKGSLHSILKVFQLILQTRLLVLIHHSFSRCISLTKPSFCWEMRAKCPANKTSSPASTDRHTHEQRYPCVRVLA